MKIVLTTRSLPEMELLSYRTGTLVMLIQKKIFESLLALKFVKLRTQSPHVRVQVQVIVANVNSMVGFSWLID